MIAISEVQRLPPNPKRKVPAFASNHADTSKRSMLTAISASITSTTTAATSISAVTTGYRPDEDWLTFVTILKPISIMLDGDKPLPSARGADADSAHGINDGQGYSWTVDE